MIEAAVIFVACALVSITVDLAGHPEGIPLFAPRPYETLVPCPATRATIGAIMGSQVYTQRTRRFVIDARETEAFRREHMDGARSVPYDYLDPTPSTVIRQLSREIASSGAQQVLVYGDGDSPDTGKLLAEELAAQGLRHVIYVQGGFPALSAAKAVRP